MEHSYCGLLDSSSWYAELLTKQIISIKSVGITVPLGNILYLDDLLRIVINSFQLYQNIFQSRNISYITIFLTSCFPKRVYYMYIQMSYKKD